jgi:competence protein ComEA
MKKYIVCASIVCFLFLGTGLALAADQGGGTGEEVNMMTQDGKLNLNAATKEKLMEVPEMTEEIADGILELREENGEFIDVEELMDVDGVDPGKLRIFKKFIGVEAVAGCNC